MTFSRLSDQPEPYAIVVMVPRTDPTAKPTAITINGRVAKLVAWLLDHRVQVEHMRGSVGFNFGPSSFQAEIRETFPHQGVAPSTQIGRPTAATHTETFPTPPTDPTQSPPERPPERP